ncbi:MAG TPA: ABC-type transport auxiliary lipoprotein family protein [Bauldia sp.]|nr:ABC-type transport auxiliary lipoprotein family protein [Bauldia sp.]
MEIKARYVLIGLFVLAVIVGGFGFVFWLNNAGGIGQRTAYRVEFDGSIAGLSAGSPVLFNGLDVGEVTSLALVSNKPGAVLATIAVNADTPVRADTHVGLIFAGLTGTATVALAGGSADSPVLAPADGQPPLLVADPASLKDVTQAARDVLARIDTVVGQNADAFKAAVANIATFSDALARNSGKVDGILEGLERLTGGKTTPDPTTYDIAPPDNFAQAEALPSKQLTIATPTTVIVLDTQRIVIQSATGTAPAFPDARFADNIPPLLQSRLVQGFENAGYLKVAADGGDLEGDYKLVLDIRKFQLDTSASPKAAVEFSAKLLDADGKVVDAKIFSAEAPVSATDDAAVAAKSIGDAFAKAATDLIGWALVAITGNEKAAPTDDDLALPPPATDEPAAPATDAPTPTAPPADAPATTSP